MPEHELNKNGRSIHESHMEIEKSNISSKTWIHKIKIYKVVKIYKWIYKTIHAKPVKQET
jgi:hypothetical protein